MLANERSPLVEPVSAYRRADGSYVVADGGFSTFNEVLVFNGRGRLVSSFGGTGDGPGEFLQVWWALSYRGDSIAVYDIRNTVSIFDDDGAFGRTVRLPDFSRPRSSVPTGTTSWAHAVYEDGSFLASPSGTTLDEGPGALTFEAELLRVGPDGASWDTLGVFPVSQVHWDGRTLGAYPFERIGHRALRGGELVFGNGETWEIRVYAPDGHLSQVVRRNDAPEPVTAADMDRWTEWNVGRHASGPEGGSAAMERASERAERVEPPETKPAFSYLLVDGAGNIWAENYRWAWDDVPPDPGPATWSVFDPDGEWITDVEVPARLLLRWVGTEYAIGFHVDELDAKHVQVFEIRKP
ncbi:MAG: 6-bladed beta-propeller [Gemmatimonadota bacterium]|nr:6-bladed beta-propeller [Gemmatimonadota bacterium]